MFAWLALGPDGEVWAVEEAGSVGSGLQLGGLLERDKDGKRYVSKSLGVTISGYFEGSYTQNFNNPSNGINQLRIFDVNANEFRPNVAKFVLEREANAGGTGWDRAGFHVKFNAGKDSQFTGGTNLNPYADFQEFYVQYVLPVGTGLDIKAGRINTLIGYEGLESPENPNYSRSWLFGLGQPFTTFGLRASYEFSKQASFSIGAINSVTSATGDSTNKPMVESALVLRPTERFQATLYGLFGPRPGQRPRSEGNRVLGGGFLSYRLTEKASMVLEAYYANQERASDLSGGGNARWDGVAGYFIYDVTKQWGFRFRSEIFEDAGGFVSCNGTESMPKANVCFGATPRRTSPDVAQTLWETTGTLQYRPLPSLLTRLEYRYDKSDRTVFQLGNRATSYQPTLTLDVVYFF
ncbi:MAG: porin [Nitrospirota bacterium]|nr:porin [Nitrospirota bacterium]MDE3241947.1 porin [Nitrospirota bacterium]